MRIQRIPDISVSRDVGVDGIPAAKVDEGVAGGVVAYTQEIGIVATPDKTAPEISSPMFAKVRGLQSSTVFGTPKQETGRGKYAPSAEIRGGDV